MRLLVTVLAIAPPACWRSSARAEVSNSGALLEAKVPRIPLPGGVSMPMSGLGLCCRPTSTGDAVRQSVYEYLMMGGRHLDDALNYNNIGEVVQGMLQAVSEGVPREEIFFSLKIEEYFYGFDSVMQLIPYCLNSTGLDYIDLVMLHHPDPYPPGQVQPCGPPLNCWAESWRALEQLKEQRLVRAFAVSNMGPKRLEALSKLVKTPIAVNQIELNPWSPEIHMETVRWCQANGIAVVSYASMGSPWSAKFQREWGHLKESNLESVARIAKRVNKTSGQVMLRWSIQHNVTVIPGTANPAHMRENIDIFDWSLSEEDMAFLDSMPQSQRGLVFGWRFHLDWGPLPPMGYGSVAAGTSPSSGKLPEYLAWLLLLVVVVALSKKYLRRLRAKSA